MSSLVAQECVEVYVHAERPPRLLLLRRTPARGGFWVPVSGKVEPSDADFPGAARRELAEETGFAEVAVEPLDWSVVFSGLDRRPGRLLSFSAGLVRARTPALSAEHDGFRWVALPGAIDELHYPDNRWAARRLAARLGAGAPAPNV